MKKISVFLISIMLFCMFTSCSDSGAKVIEKNETENKDFLAAAVAAMDDQSLCIQDKLDWGDTYDEIKKIIKEPYIHDSEQYLTKGFFAALPLDGNWADADGNICADNFISTDILSYYAIDDNVGLYEYGYLAPDANLYQYDFLKAYYTKKYGEPENETWEWNDTSYEPTGDEDYYQMFAEGLVKVITIWDIEELDSVLVIDWLNDPVQYDNNYGQISFYDRSDDFSVEDVLKESESANE